MVKDTKWSSSTIRNFYSQLPTCSATFVSLLSALVSSALLSSALLSSALWSSALWSSALDGSSAFKGGRVESSFSSATLRRFSSGLYLSKERRRLPSVSFLGLRLRLRLRPPLGLRRRRFSPRSRVPVRSGLRLRLRLKRRESRRA